MSDAATFFSVNNSLALLTWLPLTLALFVRPMRTWTWRVTGFIVPAILAVSYIVGILAGMNNGSTGGNFNSIAGIRTLFTDDWFLTAGWIHYLAFDLFVGSWIARTGTASGIHPLLLLPCIVMTCLAGPIGFLLYLILRLATGRRDWETLA